MIIGIGIVEYAIRAEFVGVVSNLESGMATLAEAMIASADETDLPSGRSRLEGPVRWDMIAAWNLITRKTSFGVGRLGGFGPPGR